MLKSGIKSPAPHHHNGETLSFLASRGKSISTLWNISEADERRSCVNIGISFQLVSVSRLQTNHRHKV